MFRKQVILQPDMAYSKIRWQQAFSGTKHRPKFDTRLIYCEKWVLTALASSNHIAIHRLKNKWWRCTKLLNFIGASLSYQAKKPKVTAFSVFKLVCAFLDFQNQEVGKGLGRFVKCDSKTYPCTAAGSSKEGCFGISASWILFCLGHSHHCTFTHPSFFGIGRNKAEWGPTYRKRQKLNIQVQSVPLRKFEVQD